MKKTKIIPKLTGAATKKTPSDVRVADKTYAQAYKNKVATPASIHTKEHKEHHKTGLRMMAEHEESRRKEYMKSKKIKKEKNEAYAHMKKHGG